MNSKPLVISLDAVACTDAAKANTIAKKNKITAAMAPRIVIAFIIRFGVTFADLNLIPANGCPVCHRCVRVITFNGKGAVLMVMKKTFMFSVLLNFTEVLLID